MPTSKTVTPIDRLHDMLRKRGHRQIRTGRLLDSASRLEWWTGNGSSCIVQVWEDGGFDVYRASMTDTLDLGHAIAYATGEAD